MKNKLIYKNYQLNSEQRISSNLINIENSEVLDVFGVNNENLSFFERILPIKIFQKGNQLNIHGTKKNINILKNAITKTINDKKLKTLVDNIHNEIKNQGNKIKSEIVGETVLKYLKETNEVAYLRFASVYKEFSDASDFEKEVAEL